MVEEFGSFLRLDLIVTSEEMEKFAALQKLRLDGVKTKVFLNAVQKMDQIKEIIVDHRTPSRIATKIIKV